MSGDLLNITNLSAGTEDKPILHNIDLKIGKGESHILMGPNGTGKSTLGHVIMGDSVYKVTSGKIEFDGKDITGLSADKRSLAGIFLSYQAPVEVPGVPLYTFLRTICQLRPELKMTPRKFRNRVSELAEQLSINEDFLGRDLNVGFSGGEKKKIEMLQLLLLQPKLAILDETDSGLDVDALSVVSKGIASYLEDGEGSVLLITHNTRILEHVRVDQTHVMTSGRLVDQGDASLIAKIEENGFEEYEREIDGAEKASDNS
ncbi:MAG: Fe-S cluster assembly ATPase SufC [Coriobacteriales bacterium]